MVVWKCHPLHLRLSLLVGVATFILLYIHILHHGSEVEERGQITEMVAKEPTHNPVSIDHNLLQKYRAPNGKSDQESKELLKCAAVGKNRNATAEQCLLTIGNEWQFDDVISEEHGCVVHAFDPSINTSHHNRGKRIHFYDVGLGKTDQLNFPPPYSPGKTWPMLTFKSMLSMLQLTHTPIAMVKMDIELGELEALHLMARDGSLDNVAQLVVEVHLNAHLGTNIPLSVYVDLLRALEDANFALYLSDPNLDAPEKGIGNVEMYFFNKVFIETMF